MKKGCMILLFVITPNLLNVVFGQIDSSIYKLVDTLKPVTISIMNKLSISIRDNLELDSPLSINIYNSKYPTARFKQNTYRVININDIWDTANRIYLKPDIWISSTLDSILRKTKRISSLKYINSIGTIIHELTHYYQSSFISPNNFIEATNENFSNHLKQLPEAEAYAVESYFVLELFNPSLLSELLNKKYSKLDLYLTLFKEADKIMYPVVKKD